MKKFFQRMLETSLKKERFFTKNIQEPNENSFCGPNTYFDYRFCDDKAFVAHYSVDGAVRGKLLKVSLHKLQANSGKNIKAEDLRDQEPVEIINDVKEYSHNKFLSNQYIILASSHKVGFYNFATAKKMFSLKGRFLPRNIVLVSPTIVAIENSANSIVEIRDIRNGQLLKKVKPNLKCCALTSLSEKTLLILDNEGNYEIFDIKSGKIMATAIMGTGISTVFLAMASPKGDKIAIYCIYNDKHSIIFFDLTQNKIVKKIDAEEKYQQQPLWFQYKVEDEFSRRNVNKLIDHEECATTSRDNVCCNIF